ncbi:hypothetical protein [Thermofilum pendens]|uniref:hypothetical protein n=1 Tax=Thermofilum pendens TaxID=2269 RepID=UPI00069BC74B|nr:hypothetical protein [Thermofilum pendens]
MAGKKRFIARVDEEGNVKLPLAVLKDMGVTLPAYVSITREGSALLLRFRTKRSPLRLGRQIRTEEMEKLIKEALDELVIARWET